MGDSFQITIMGQTFLLKGSHDKQYVARVEDFLNREIEKARSSGSIADTFNLMVLVALNLADDCIKKDDEINSLKQSKDSIDSDLQKLINLIDSRM